MNFSLNLRQLRISLKIFVWTVNDSTKDLHNIQKLYPYIVKISGKCNVC